MAAKLHSLTLMGRDAYISQYADNQSGCTAGRAYAARPIRQSDIRWGWILAVAIGSFLGLLLATWLGETGARLGAPDEFDLEGRPPTHAERVLFVR